MEKVNHININASFHFGIEHIFDNNKNFIYADFFSKGVQETGNAVLYCMDDSNNIIKFPQNTYFYVYDESTMERRGLGCVIDSNHWAHPYYNINTIHSYILEIENCKVYIKYVNDSWEFTTQIVNTLHIVTK